MSLPIIGAILGGVTDLIGDMHTSDKEKLDAEIELRKLGLESERIDAGLLTGQIDVNKEEAKHASVFVAGGRPAILWVGAVSLGWTYVAHPIMTWLWAILQGVGWIAATLPPPPILDIEALMVLVGGVLGLGGFRSIEKVKGVARDRLNAKEKP